ncbi:ribosome maturation factor RimP [Clostridium fallax]|uniref:Ribosome maturation factor RimP n=1 Tax=Clostridium fallax TaxID=1533 RepID=A0A1M4V2X6_9CLOT|nr:ribosome maturation factor RimP [Clostridium fallax]SHE63295.1 ribosome maturation factor RimP [Clostridium fallax]SQB06576.1 ribosome maturation factor RimP [Clostridium fallax]
MKKDVLVSKLNELIKPIVCQLNYELYHLEYVKENNEFYLRIYIDKEEGFISLTDCETVSRAISEILDTEDPIKDPYYLEVCSPGLNRALHTDEHYKKYIGSEVLVRFIKSLNGKKNVKGFIEKIDEEALYVKELDSEEIVRIPKDKIKSVNLEGEL